MNRSAFAVVSVVACMSSGCALIPVAALGVAGSAADIGSTAFSVGTEVFSAGKMESVEFATFDQAQAAVRWTLNDLRLRLKDVKLRKAEAHFNIVDDAGSGVKIDLKRRTSAVCQVRIDVGWFGSEAYARLLLKSVRGRLPAATGSATTQPETPVDLSRKELPPGVRDGDI